ncbi:MAG: hypothetical protein M1827_006369 [Pycnora praestabilis]|nr:MAG: hypothetical protein M1827_006369 [Pycnora praestabilis]
MSINPITGQLMASPPPPGVNPHYEDPEYNAQILVILCSLGAALATIFWAVRIYTKLFIVRLFGTEDVCITIAWMCVIVLDGIVAGGTLYGEGRHIWNVTIPGLNFFLRGSIVVNIMYIWAMAFSKFSILFFYHRLSPQRYFRMACVGLGTFVFLYSLPISLSTVFACRPLSKAWDALVPTDVGTCIDRGAIYIFVASINAATDLMILALPLPMLWKLEMPRKQKLAVGAVFAVGSLLIRLKELHPLLSSPDQTWAIVTPGLLAIVEASLAVVTGCVTVFKPFLRRHAPILIGETMNKRSNYMNSDFSGKRVRNSGIGSKNQFERMTGSGASAMVDRSWPSQIRSHNKSTSEDDIDLEMNHFKRAGGSKAIYPFETNIEPEVGTDHRHSTSESQEAIILDGTGESAEPGIVKTVRIDWRQGV